MGNEHIPVDLTVKYDQGPRSGASLADKLEFAHYSAGLYMKEGLKGDSLLEYMKEHFEQYCLEDFEQISSTTRRKLSEYPRSNGVYVPKGTNICISDALHTVANEDLQWPRDDPQRPCTDSNVGISLQPIVTSPHENKKLAQAIQYGG